MSVGEVCDWAYLLIVEQVRTLALADRTGLMAAQAMSGQLDPDSLPEPEAAVARLDDLLILDPAEFSPADQATADLLDALGLRR